MSNVLNKFRKHGKQSGQTPRSDQPKARRTEALREWEEQGAWRADENGTFWWLNVDQLLQLHELNDQCTADREGDAKFWKLFADFRRSEGITTRKGAQPRSDTGDWWGSLSSKPKSWSWDDPLKKKGSLSEWWTGYKPTTWINGDKSAKVALAMQAVEDTVRVIDDSGKRVSVVPHTSEEHSVSFTDFKRNRITVSAKPILEGKLPEGEAMDVMTGFGLHEASHSKKEGTRKYMPLVEKNELKKELQPIAVTAQLFNIVEDKRIEAHTVSEFPGFAGYFDACLSYVWNEGKPPKKYGPDLASKLNAVVAFLRWPEESSTVLTDKSFVPERAWWTDWDARYLPALGAGKLIEHLEEGMAHLRAATQEEEQKGKGKKDDRSDSGQSGQASTEMDQIQKNEEELRQLGAVLDQLIRKFREDMKELNDFCSHQDGETDEQLSQEEAQIVQRLRDEQLQRENTPIRTDDGAGNPTLWITKPLESNSSKRAGQPKHDPMLNKYKSALLFRDDVPVDSIKLSREGSVDDDELWRWAADDWRVFQEREEKRLTNARVYLLIDMSGSMGRSWGEGQGKIDAAQRMARLFTEALTSMDGVTPKVFGHTGDLEGHATSHIFRIWEPGDPMTRLGLISTSDMGNNYDGHAIAWVAKEMMGETQGDEQKILIVVSDGIPAGSGYGGEQGMAHVRKVVADCKRKGIRVLQMAIDPEMDADRQKKMYDEYIPYDPSTPMDAVPRKLTAWLAKQI